MMSGWLGDALLIGTPEPFFEDLGGKPSMESGGLPYRAEVGVIDIVGRAASVRVDETGLPGGIAFTNWFQLLKGDDESWKIVSKLFTTRTDGPGDDR